MMKGHSFEYINYVPDFDHQCYLLQFKCEECGAETFDKIRNIIENQDEHRYYLKSDVARRYRKKPFAEQYQSHSDALRIVEAIPSW